MTKADGFRVVTREGGVGVWWEARDRLGVLDRALGSLAPLVRRPETLLDMLDIEANKVDEELGPICS